jgi:hypothetical protein
MQEGESYGGRSENIPEGCPAVLGAPANAPKPDRRQVIHEFDVAAIFDRGPLPKAEALEKLRANTGASRATCYRAVDPSGRFAEHLRCEKGKLSWR